MQGKALIKNYAILETAVEEHREIFFSELNRQTDTIQEINAALNDRDVVTVLSMIEEQLPIAEKLAKSKYYVVEEDAVSIMKRDTRHFAKRQITWFKRERQVTWIEKDQYAYDEERILNAMIQYTKGVIC